MDEASRIHFCDLCNESVPEPDLEEGRAFVRKGRIVCASCDHAMSSSDIALAAALPRAPLGRQPAILPDAAGLQLQGRAPAPPAARGPVGYEATPHRSGSGLAWLALLFAAASGFWLYQRQEQAAADLRQALAQASGQNADQASLDQRLVELQQAAGELQARVEERLREGELDWSRELGSMRTRAEELAKSLEGLSNRVEGMGSLELGLRENQREAADLRQGIRAVVTELDDIAARVGKLQEGAGGPTRAAPSAELAEQLPAWTTWVADLQSPNSGTRWTAVTALGETRDPSVAPHLTPLLRDSDVFVRMATARVLGDLSAPEGIPALIEALEDVEAPVREAAESSLRQITGRNFHFDPLADEADRARKIRAWQQWWRESRDNYIGQNVGQN
jgi:hypothetical protein